MPSDGTSVSATNILQTYTMAVNIGNPPTTYSLLIDTGSSNTWCGAATAYNPTSTSNDTGSTVSVSYGSGQFSGEEYTDQVDLGGGLVINNQSIGVASTDEGFQGVDGIIGIGPVDLTDSTVSSGQPVPTVTDNLYQQGTIQTEMIGIYYAPTTHSGTPNGELTFGGIDQSRITSDVTYTPITSTSPASNYWGIDQTISYGGQQILSSAGIVDTGTTLVLIASDAFQAYMQAIPGSKVDQNSGLLEVPANQVATLQPLAFNIGGTTFKFTGTDQLLDQSLNEQFGGTRNAYYSIVSDLGSESGQGLDFINGYFFLERFYSVYDTTNRRVGFATTANS
ncbi:aspartic proteinase precursor [Dacryopinax primogenitus]|uniref:Aspartic proteinase n=1 Tax=Dacryopinax primogenitus (strain DJM 731) TaxID=1858805 RepID=M5G6A2_DACPD|nr:aspartic proteinase precursor [Dacryopinax primogenitus]EJU03730.1 aspartic proteinase precursor [Dacryopinax primogenitus]